MLAVSSCNRLRMIERLVKKPCWRGKIQLVRCSSQRLRAALATMRLSQFTMLSGRVLLVVYASVPWMCFFREAHQGAVVVVVGAVTVAIVVGLK